MSDVTSRVAAGGLGAAAAALAVLTLGVVAGSGPEPPAETAAAIAARVPGATPPTPAGDVLPAVGEDAPVPSGSALDAQLRPQLAAAALAGSASLDVVDIATGERLTSLGETVVRTPASTAKILTAVAALKALGTQSTLPTRTALAGDQVVLVGGGDILLAPDAGDPGAVNGHAGIGDLARATAAMLKERGTTAVTVRLDDTLFTGPAVAPGWSPSDIRSGFVAPVQAVEINAGRLGTARYAPRQDDPALRAASTFAARLRAAGITVRGAVARGATPPGAEDLAEVRSASIGDQVEYALTESDNTVAEALARLVARKSGAPAAFAGVGGAIVDEIAKLGVPVEGAVLSDGSGLGDGSVVAPVTLTEVLALAASDEHPDLRPVLTGLPVAGVSGTLTDRFASANSRASAGLVRAKTGSLNGVSSLAGTVVDADGRQLAFAVLADGVAATGTARLALDRLVTTIAECGCR